MVCTIDLMCCLSNVIVAQPNHLIGLKKKYMMVSFNTVKDLLAMRDKLARDMKRNKQRKGIAAIYEEDG
jgi:hypothetical protein